MKVGNNGAFDSLSMKVALKYLSLLCQALYEWDPGEDPEEQENESILVRKRINCIGKRYLPTVPYLPTYLLNVNIHSITPMSGCNAILVIHVPQLFAVPKF
jgi:hypothetical protein